MECVISGNLANSACLPERDEDYTTTDSGGLHQMIVHCQCFTDDDPCQDNP